MVNNTANIGLTQQQVSDAMRGIREAISSNDIPNTDVLELTEKVSEPTTPSTDKKAEIPQDDPFISILDDALNNKKNLTDSLIKPQIMNESQDAMRQFMDAANKKSIIEKGNHSALEAIVIEALKPQLSAWLNAHLPEIVHDIVTKEIKKLVP